MICALICTLFLSLHLIFQYADSKKRYNWNSLFVLPSFLLPVLFQCTKINLFVSLTPSGGPSCQWMKKKMFLNCILPSFTPPLEDPSVDFWWYKLQTSLAISDEKKRSLHLQMLSKNKSIRLCGYLGSNTWSNKKSYLLHLR